MYFGHRILVDIVSFPIYGMLNTRSAVYDHFKMLIVTNVHNGDLVFKYIT